MTNSASGAVGAFWLAYSGLPVVLKSGESPVGGLLTAYL